MLIQYSKDFSKSIRGAGRAAGLGYILGGTDSVIGAVKGVHKAGKLYDTFRNSGVDARTAYNKALLGGAKKAMILTGLLNLSTTALDTYTSKDKNKAKVFRNGLIKGAWRTGVAGLSSAVGTERRLRSRYNKDISK